MKRVWRWERNEDDGEGGVAFGNEREKNYS